MADSEEYSVYPQAVVLAVLAFFASILDIPPFIWHIKHRNLAASGLVFWFLLLNTISIINAIIWPTDDLAHFWGGQGLCDVQVYLQVASRLSIPGCLVCTMQSLARVLDSSNVVVAPSRARRIRQFALDLFWCFGIPVLGMATFFLVQSRRFTILGIVGCLAVMDTSWLGLILVIIWPLVVTLVATFYAGLVIYRLHRYRLEISHILEISNMTQSRFLRLFLLSSLLICGILPAQTYVLSVNVAHHHDWHYSWSKVHSKSWNIITMIASGGGVYYDRWIWIAGGYLVFLLFGVGTDASEMYRNWLTRFRLAWLFSCCIRSHHDDGTNYSRSPIGFNFSNRVKSAFSSRSHKNSCSDTSSLAMSAFCLRSLPFWQKAAGFHLPTTGQDSTTYSISRSLTDPLSDHKVNVVDTNALAGSPVSDMRLLSNASSEDGMELLPRMELTEISPTAKTSLKEAKGKMLEVNVLDKLCVGKPLHQG